MGGILDAPIHVSLLWRAFGIPKKQINFAQLSMLDGIWLFQKHSFQI
jgi:hypothetical protein